MAATAVSLRSRRRPRRVTLRPVGDDRLVARVRAGDDEAFEAIYDRYSRGLLAFCRHMVGSRQEAEDALQHSFASAYRALRGGDTAVELRPWLYTIARNRCLTVLRSRRDELCVDGAELDHRSLDGLPAQIALRDELRELVDDLQRLPEDQRAALVLFELGDHSHEEIAAVLEVRREKVKALVFQARAALLRARTARDASCLEIRELLATQPGALAPRGLERAHVDRCAGCTAFERDVRRQRKALAAILPVAPTVGLKASVLGFTLGGGGGAAALTGAGGGATAVAGGAIATTAATAGGGSAVTVAGAIGTAGAATVAGGLASGTAAHVAGGVAGATAKGLVTKILAVVAVAGGASEARHVTADHALAGAVAAPQSPLVASATIPTSAEPLAVAAAKAAGTAVPAAGEPVDAPAAQNLTAPDPSHTGAVPASIPGAPAHPSVQPVVAPPASTPPATSDPAPAAEAPAATEAPAAPAPDPGAADSDPAATPSEPAATPSDPAADASPAPPPDATIDPDPDGAETTVAAEDSPPPPADDPPADPQPAG